MPSHPIPAGFRLAGVHCGIKRNPAREDLALIVSDRDAAAAGAYTQNIVYAASVGRNRRITPAGNIRALVINSGNANTCTGQRGEDDNEAMAGAAAEAIGGAPEQVLVMSTGIIGEFLPIERILSGIADAASRLADDEQSLIAAARGMKTTDKVEKIASRTIRCGDRSVHLTGLAKGAGMIGPSMATMLAALLTDAPLSAASAQDALAFAVRESFNCMSVEGHMSTSDSVVLLAGGGAGGAPLEGDDLAAFRGALLEICVELARAIPADGEGASHLIEIAVSGCASREDALQIAKTAANSALVKTAVAGGDPNWGRIVSAAGYSGVKFDPSRLTLDINGVRVFESAAPTSFDAGALSRSIRDQWETKIVLTFGEGNAGLKFWTSDMTAEYIKINADYHT